MPDPDPTVHLMQRCLAEFYACATTHDPDITARALAADEVADAIDTVAVLRVWLNRYAEALHRRL